MRDYKTPLEKAKRRTPKSASPKLAKNLGTGEGRENLLERKTGIASRRGDKRATGAFASSPTLDLSLPGSFAIDRPSTTPDADFSLPGSIHIDGGFQVHSPSWDEEDNRAVEAEASETGLIAGDAAVFEAELVDPQEKEEERDRIRREALQEVEKNAAKAEVVDDEAERKRRRQKTLFLVCIACCALLAAIIATTVALTKDDEPDIFILPTSAPTTRADGLNETLNNCETRPLGLDDFDSPQYAAADWMVQNDTTLIFPIESEEECTRFRQRWAMCVLSFTTNVYGWADRGDWLKPVDICKWFGLVCDGEGLLVGISLPAIEGLRGSLPTELGFLSDLKYLLIHENPELGGALPSDLGNATSLVSFYGQNNNFTGTIPNEYAELSSLEKLDLSNNQLTGPIPIDVADMIELVDLDLSSNNLAGPIPEQIWRLVRLETLRLQGNQVNGTIPSHIGSMVELQHIELQNNLLEGPIPETLGYLPRLQTMTLFGNLLTGIVPDSLCALREDLPFAGLNVLETDCMIKLSCDCCTRCY